MKKVSGRVMLPRYALFKDEEESVDNNSFLFALWCKFPVLGLDL